MARSLNARDIVAAAGFIVGFIGSVDTVVVNHPSPIWWLLLGGLIVLAIMYAAIWYYGWDLPISPGPRDPFEVRSVLVTGPEVNMQYPLKIRVTLHNRLPDAVHVDPPDWVTGLRGAQPHRHPDKGFGIYCQVEDGEAGARTNTWKPEAPSATVPGNATFRCWIGVDPTQSPHELRRLHDARRLGTLVLPVTIAGKPLELRLRV